MDALLVVLEVLNAVSAEVASQGFALTLVLVAPPLLDLAEHQATSITGTIIAVLAKSRVVKDTSDDAVHSAGDVGVLIIPALHDLGDNPLQHSAGDLAGGLVEDVGEVILRKHTVSGVCVVVVGEDSHLVVLAALDDLTGTGVKLVLDLGDDGHDVWRQKGEHEQVDLVLQLLEDVREDGDLVDRR